MRDLTQGSIRGHLVSMSLRMLVGMLVQTLYFLVDLYFVAGVGKDAVAGVTAAGNAVMAVIAVTQVLTVGTVALIAHAAGAKDQARGNAVFNQAVLLALLAGGLTLLVGIATTGIYMGALGATPEIVAAGTTYLHWYLPGLALQFALAVPGAALRGTGLAKPTMAVQLITVLINIGLAPVLVAGWGTGHPMGVAGAGLASTLAAAAGVILMLGYFARLEHFVAFSAHLMRPNRAILVRLLQIGLPSGGEFLLLFLLNSAIYAIIRDFGPDAQAGFGIGSRIMQALFMPTMALSFAVPAVGGQNFGARHSERVRETLKQALLLEIGLMAVTVAIAQTWTEVPVAWFTHDPATAEVAVGFLRIISWNFFAIGIVFACSGMFQALGNTLPSLASSATRLVTFVLPAVWWSHQPGFRLLDVWHLSVASVIVQAVTSLLLVRWQLAVRLQGRTPAAAASS